MIPEIIYDRDCTVLFATNTFLSKYAQVAHPYDFYSIKYLVVGAEKLTEDVQRLCMEKFGLRVLEGYGATECSPVISVNTPLAARPGTVGELLPGIEHRVAPVEGVEYRRRAARSRRQRDARISEARSTRSDPAAAVGIRTGLVQHGRRGDSRPTGS